MNSSVGTLPAANIVRLSNGLTVIHQEMSTEAVVVDVWVKAGAIAEPAHWSGMAHFLEHMIFKGTQRLQPGEFDWAIESQGGETNAATSHDYAHFYIMVTASALAQTLPFLADLLLFAAVPDAEFDRERQVVFEEIRQAHDDPDWVGYQALCELIYGNHAYGRAVLGTPESLAARSPREMRQFHQAYYQPENMTVAIAGGIDQAQALALVEASFGRFADRTLCPGANSVPLRKPCPQHQTLHLPHLEQSRLTLAWLGPGVDHMAAASGLDLISVLLGGGRMARLVKDLREERQLVQDIDSSFSLQQQCSLFSLSLWLEADQLTQVEALVRDHLRCLATEPISAAELARAQRLLTNDYAFSIETPGQVAGLYGFYATLAQPELASDYPGLLLSHTPESLAQLACQYLSPEAYSAVTLLPAA